MFITLVCMHVYIYKQMYVYSICIGKIYITKYKNWFSEVMYVEKKTCSGIIDKFGTIDICLVPGLMLSNLASISKSLLAAFRRA